jgi:hypothetical protein
MDGIKIPEKLEKIMDIVKQNAVTYAHFIKTRIKLYEITREYNSSVYELGHQFYATAKSGLDDVKVFSSSVERLKELENRLMTLKEELHQPELKQTSDSDTKQ